jgi:hypothetical protein
VALLEHVGGDEFLDYGGDGWATGETILSSWSGSDDEVLKEAARALPAKIAAVMRCLLDEGEARPLACGQSEARPGRI